MHSLSYCIFKSRASSYCTVQTLERFHSLLPRKQNPNLKHTQVSTLIHFDADQ